MFLINSRFLFSKGGCGDTPRWVVCVTALSRVNDEETPQRVPLKEPGWSWRITVITRRYDLGNWVWYPRHPPPFSDRDVRANVRVLNRCRLGISWIPKLIVDMLGCQPSVHCILFSLCKEICQSTSSLSCRRRQLRDCSPLAGSFSVKGGVEAHRAGSCA